ncbi:MAG: Eco57I restriction-modification methylase domain-containing protein, partial [Acidimicrobiales bacterium]
MALELAKISLWLEAIEPGRPLSFLDHHLVRGNALLGVTPTMLARPIPDEAFKALSGDDKSVASAWRKSNSAVFSSSRGGFGLFALGSPVEELVADLARRSHVVEAMADDTLDEVEAKRQSYEALIESADATRARLSADAWCAAFFAPKRAGVPRITTETVTSMGEGVAAPEALPVILEAREHHDLLHWHLAFPEVFERGGFSLVVGNPPWEKVKLSEKEFFAARYPEIAQAAGARRKAMIARLEEEDPALWAAYQGALRDAEAESLFLRASGRFPLCGRGDINTYAVFAEAMRDALAPDGRLGVIVPTGIATDDTTKEFFGDCVSEHRLVSLFDFENGAPLFPGVHRGFKFCLLTLTGSTGGAGEVEFVFFARDPRDLADPDRRFTLAPEDLVLLNPNTKTAPVFRSRRDAELTTTIYRRVPVLVREDDPGGNPWGIRFSRMFDMTNDSGLFRTANELETLGAQLDGNVWRRGTEAWLPLYEAKMTHHFNHRWGDYAMQRDGSADTQLPDISDAQLANPEYVVQPRYWVAESEVRDRLPGPSNWLLGFRDITNSTNERTMIACVLPVVAVGNNEPLIFSEASGRLTALLPAVLSTFVVDFCTRVKVGGSHINFFIAKQLPVLAPSVLESRAPWSSVESVADWMRPRVLELTYTAVEMAGFAFDLGYDGPPFKWDTERRRQLR